MWFAKDNQVRSSGWSGSEKPIPDLLPGFDVGRRSGLSESLDLLRSWHRLLEKDLLDRPADVILQMREQTVRLAISKLEELL